MSVPPGVKGIGTLRPTILFAGAAQSDLAGGGRDSTGPGGANAGICGLFATYRCADASSVPSPGHAPASMSRLRAHIERLSSADRWTYRAGVESASEPAAWAAAALVACGEAEAALRPARWLAGLQQSYGSVGISIDEDEPRWPTSLALLAWSMVDRATQADRFRTHIERTIAWSLAEHGKTAPHSPQIGHDTTIVGWSWAADTASWLEPTCCFILGLTAAGYGDHPRVREGRRLVADRLLPDGGANYGNTIVLGQRLLPHLAPTGLAMLALAGRAQWRPAR